MGRGAGFADAVLTGLTRPCRHVDSVGLVSRRLTATAHSHAQIADDLDRTPGEIAKKLEDLRNRIL